MYRRVYFRIMAPETGSYLSKNDDEDAEIGKNVIVSDRL